MRLFLFIIAISITLSGYSQNNNSVITQLPYQNTIKTKSNKKWVKSATNRAIPISNIKSDDFKDLMFLKDYIKDKRIVFLGESLHGVNNFNILKFRLIRFLHQEMNFKIVAFESGVHECGMTNLAKDSLSAPQLLSHSLKVIWWVKSNCEMMNYFINNNINFAGIDPNNVTAPIKINSYYNIFKNNNEVAENMFALDSLCFNYIVKRNKYYSNKGLEKNTVQYLDSISKNLIKNYTSLQKGIISDDNILNHTKLILKEVIDSKIHELKASNNKESLESFYITYNKRDSLMVRSLEFLVDSLYPNQKIIVWAHNAHICKGGLDNNMNKGFSFGTYLSDRIKNLSYVIALHSWGGEYSIGYKSYKFKKIKRNSFESILYNVPYDNFFLPISSYNFNKPENKWLTKPIVEFWSGSHNIIKEKYDAVFFTKKNDGSKLINYSKIEICE